MRLAATHPLLQGVQPQTIANTLWACAKLRINPGDAALNSLLQAMARPAMLEVAVAQDTSNALWAVSELQQRCDWQPQVQLRVWQRLLGEQQLDSLANRGNSQMVANALVALARLSVSPTAPALSAISR
jgi:hypothetical protein